MLSLLHSPPFARFICVQMWGRWVLSTALPAPFSATLSPALSIYLRECGATGSASDQTACPIRPILQQFVPPWPRESSPPWLPISAPPTVVDECLFFISLVVPLPCCSILCQFWLCEEAQCVHLHCHPGSLIWFLHICVV